MPRFFFDVSHGDQYARDDDGIELAGEREACDEAASILPDMASEAPPSDEPRRFEISVRDEAGTVIFSGAVVTEPKAQASSHPQIVLKLRRPV